jgi:hypothetical protein
MNKSRKTKGTEEEFNIKELSIGVVSNMDEDYRKKGKKTFNDMFTNAVINRFFPVMLKGYLTHNFNNNVNVKKVSTDNNIMYKNMIATLNYWRDNKLNIEPIPYDYKIPFLIKRTEKRYKRTFDTVCKYFSHYATDKETYIKLVEGLYSRHEDYKKYLQILNNTGISQHISFEEEEDMA